MEKAQKSDLFSKYWKDTQANIWVYIDKYKNYKEILEDPFIQTHFEYIIRKYYNKNNFNDSEHKLNYLKKCFKPENFHEVISWQDCKAAWAQEWKAKYLWDTTKTKNRKLKALQYFSNIETFADITKELVDLDNTKLNQDDPIGWFVKNKQQFIDKYLIPAFQAKDNNLLNLIMLKNKIYSKSKPLDIFAYSNTSNGNPLNVSQLIALKAAHDKYLTNIKGPPGTGKTTLLKDIVVSLLLNKQTIEITSSNNEAVDNVLRVFQEDKTLKNLPILRLGNIENCQKTYVEIFKNYDFNSQKKRHHNQARPEPINNLINELITIKNDQENQANKKTVLELTNPSNIIINDLQDLSLISLKWWNKTLSKILKVIKAINYKCSKWSFVMFLWNRWRHYHIVRKIKKLSLTFYQANNFQFNANHEEIIFNISWAINTVESLIFAKNKKPLRQETKILKMIAQRSSQTTQAIQQLIQTKTNQQSQAIEKIKLLIENEAQVIRTKSFEKNEEESKNIEGKILRQLYCGETLFYTHKKLDSELRDLFPVVLTTTLSANNFKSIEKTDYCIIDEAAQTTIHSVLGLTHNFNNMVLLGDTSQLDAVVSLDKKKEAAVFEKSQLPHVYRNIKNSVPLIIENILPASISFMLNEHWRCVPAIANFFNRYYGYQLILKREGQDVNKHMQVDIYKDKFIDKIKELEAEYAPIIAESPQKVALMSPFREIRNLKSQIVKKGTTHKFQGYENDVIIYYIDNVKKNNRFLADIFLNDQLINVAVSRAKNKFHLVIPQEAYNQITQDNKGSQIYALINYIERGKTLDVQMFYSQLDSWNKTSIQHQALTESNYYIGHIKKALFDYLKVQKLFITFGVRDVDVNDDLKNIEDYKQIYDLVIFNFNGEIQAILHQQEIIYSQPVCLNKLLTLGFKANIDEHLTKLKKIMTERELLYFQKIVKNLKNDKTILPSVSMQKILPQLKRWFHFDLVFVDFYCHQDYCYYEHKFILELDDATHLTKAARIRDVKKNEICQKYQIKLLRLNI